MSTTASPRSESLPATILALVYLGCLVGISLGVLALGYDYYPLTRALRVEHPLHDVLRPGGTVGVGLAVLGTTLMLVMHVYSVRKWFPRSLWLGPVPRWLQFHIISGVMGPVFILEHNAFLWPRGLISIGFYCMVLVAASGVFGRYVYGFFPANAAGRVEDLDETREELAKLREELVRDTEGVHAPAIQEAIAQAHDVDHQPRSVLGLLPLSAELYRRSRRIRGLLASTDLPRDRRRRAVRALVGQLRLVGSVATWEVAGRMLRLWHVFHLPLAKAMYAIVALHLFTAVVLGGSLAQLRLLFTEGI